MRRHKRFVGLVVTVALLAMAFATMGWLLAGCDEDVSTVTEAGTLEEKTLGAGEDWQIAETTKLGSLTIAEGATITPPEGKSVTLTVNGVETGQALRTTDGYDLVFVAGTYEGDVVVTVADANPVPFTPMGPAPEPVVSPVRQAICVDENGLSEAKSVLAAVVGELPTPESAEDLTITSTGECFNAIYAASSYVVKDVDIDLTGNGRSDFSGYGAAVVGTGENTTLVLDGVNIVTDGVARAGVIATNSANVIVKNSDIQTNNGELPDDYIPTIDMTQMRSVPWMLGLSGNVRATNLLGTNTRATYINSSIASEGWGVLSTDAGQDTILTAINSTISITGEDGYGSYGIGDATEYFLGSTFDVATYSTISRGSFLYYGDSTPEKIADLNDSLELGLTDEELDAISNQPTVVNSDRFGVMWHGGGTLDVSGGTVFNTEEATFLDKGQAVTIIVDGSDGAELNPANGIIMQFMDDDDPGPDFATMQNTLDYNEPIDPVAKDDTHDLSRAADGTDALATFKNIKLAGDFYNSTRGGMAAPMGPPPGPPPGDAGGPPPGPPPGGEEGGPPAEGAPPGGGGAPGEMVSISKNLGLTFDNAKITGVITASTAVHSQPTITAADYKLLGEVTNTASAAVNNGVVIVLTNGSVWTVTGTCYITSLTIGEDCSVVAPEGKTLTMKVDGKSTDIKAGTYAGAIELIVE